MNKFAEFIGGFVGIVIAVCLGLYFGIKEWVRK
jgi:hypothetical protein